MNDWPLDPSLLRGGAGEGRPPLRPFDEDELLDLIFREVPYLAFNDPRAPTDPLLTEMIRLRGQPDTPRLAALEPYVTRWIEEGRDRIGVAMYLACAGVKREQADLLEARVRARVTARLRVTAYSRMATALFIWTLAGLLMLYRIPPYWGPLAVGLLIFGGMALWGGVQMMNRTHPPAE